MRFLVDAQLPRTLCDVLRRLGCDSIHTTDLPSGTRTPDSIITEVATREQRVLITKDSDFFHSHVLTGAPPKLILVRTGNIGVRDLCALFEADLPTMISALEDSTLIEIDRRSVRPL